MLQICAAASSKRIMTQEHLILPFRDVCRKRNDGETIDLRQFCVNLSETWKSRFIFLFNILIFLEFKSNSKEIISNNVFIVEKKFMYQSLREEKFLPNSIIAQTKTLFISQVVILKYTSGNPMRIWDRQKYLSWHYVKRRKIWFLTWSISATLYLQPTWGTCMCDVSVWVSVSD